MKLFARDKYVGRPIRPKAPSISPWLDSRVEWVLGDASIITSERSALAERLRRALLEALGRGL